MSYLFHAQKYYLLLLASLFLYGCQTAPAYDVIQASTESFFYDQGFEGGGEFKVETEQEIFYLDEEAKEFVHETIKPHYNQVAKMESLVHAIFDRSELNLLYEASANTVASDTFREKRANCLSMSIMTYALAKEAGLNINFQEVLIPEYWTRRQGYSLLNGHINLKFVQQYDENLISFIPRSYQIDFDPQAFRKGFKRKVVSKNAIIAMYYNNKGADALLKNSYSEAYAYFKRAALVYPEFKSTWINLGILYRKKGYVKEAENVYLRVLHYAPESLTAWENLAYLYKYIGETKKAKKINTDVERKRRNNPYYHVNLGEQELESRNWELALGHFKKALMLNREAHEGYFGVARAYYGIGKLKESERYLQLAKNNAVNGHFEEKYQSKLNFLSRL